MLSIMRFFKHKEEPAKPAVLEPRFRVLKGLARISVDMQKDCPVPVVTVYAVDDKLRESIEARISGLREDGRDWWAILGNVAAFLRMDERAAHDIAKSVLQAVVDYTQAELPFERPGLDADVKFKVLGLSVRDSVISNERS
jgi:hypothetical protein